MQLKKYIVFFWQMTVSFDTFLILHIYVYVSFGKNGEFNGTLINVKNLRKMRNIERNHKRTLCRHSLAEQLYL